MFCICLLKTDHSKNIMKFIWIIFSQLACIDAIDIFLRNITVLESQLDAIKQINIIETGNLASQLNLSQVMLTLNIDIDDRLVNVLVRRIKEFKSLNNAVSVLCVKLMMTVQD